MVMLMTIVREARLKPEFAHLYPELPAGHWMPASEVGATILMTQLKALSLASGLRTRRGEPGTTSHQH
jgi:hypothetical protein